MRKYVWMFLIIGLLGSVIMMLTGNFFTIIGYFIIYFIITFALLGYSYQNAKLADDKIFTKFLIHSNQQTHQK